MIETIITGSGAIRDRYTVETGDPHLRLEAILRRHGFEVAADRVRWHPREFLFPEHLVRCWEVLETTGRYP